MNIKKQRPVLVIERGGKKELKEIKQVKEVKMTNSIYECFKNAKAHWFPVTTPDKNGNVIYCCSKCRAFASFTDNCKQEKCGNCGEKMNIKE